MARDDPPDTPPWIGEIRHGGTAPTSLDAALVTVLPFLPPAEHAGLAVRRAREYVPLASTSEAVNRCERLQAEMGEGPGLLALLPGSLVVSGDVSQDRRWPHWGPRASRYRVSSVLAVGMEAPDGGAAVLSLYAAPRDAFSDPDDVEVAPIVALHLAHLLAGTSLAPRLTLRNGASQSHELDLALGILMESRKLSLDEAIVAFRAEAHRSRLAVADLARHVVEHRSFPEEPLRG